MLSNLKPYVDDRDFATIQKQRLLGDMGEEIIRRLENAPGGKGRRMRILDVGCGSGAALIELKKRFPEAEFVGLDKGEFEESKEFTRIQGNIEDPEILNGQQFDIVFSSNCWAYVRDKQVALKNVARMLKDQDSLGIIGVEPVYFGPDAYQIDKKAKNGSPVLEWHSDHDGRTRTLLVTKGTPEQVDGIMSNVTQYKIPKKFLQNIYPNLTHPLQPGIIPATYPEEKVNGVLAHYEKSGTFEFGRTPIHVDAVDWSEFNFLDFNIYNPSGVSGTGRPGYRAFQLAAPTVYLEKVGLSEKELESYLGDAKNWDSRLKKLVINHVNIPGVSRRHRGGVCEKLAWHPLKVGVGSGIAAGVLGASLPLAAVVGVAAVATVTISAACCRR